MEEKDKTKLLTVKCPKCGYEYQAAEIFYPKDLLGYPREILRDENGKILMVSGDEPCWEEEWECENCSHKFIAKLTIKADIFYDSKYDFDDEYVIDLNDKDKEELF